MLIRTLASTVVATACSALAAADGDRVAFASLRGGIGFQVGRLADGGFDSRSIEALLAETRRRSCSALLLEIESPGGLVLEGERIADALVAAQASGMKVVAWYGQAFSAASWIPFASRIAVAKPTGTCGGSVIVAESAGGKVDAVAAKLASATIGKIRNAAHAGGKDALLVDAVFLQEAEVWRTADGKLHPRDPGGGARCLDGGKTVLNLSAKDACDIGFAKGIASTRDDAVAMAGIKDPSWVDVSDVVERRARRIREQEVEWHASVKKWGELVPELMRKLDKAIEDSRTTAKAYDEGTVGNDADIRQLGARARKDLRDFINGRFRKSIAPGDFDDGLYQGAEESVRLRITELQQGTSSRIASILKLLESRKLVRIQEAASQRNELQAWMQGLLKD